MSIYQFHCLSSGGLDIKIQDIDCCDDVAAVARAHLILSSGGIAEVWASYRSVDVIFVPLPARPEAISAGSGKAHMPEQTSFLPQAGAASRAETLSNF